ncbi:MAG: LacI family DNA-binding transcriptional regulator [Burkholderiaceae bacterium]|nr:LacI family DNA-binding transcriptional regulator [Burkholderiaceae bacterium]
MAATIKDVARIAGVSVATVSRAMNGHANVLPLTRERILDAAKQLRFTPSGTARSLIMRRTDTIGALLPDLHGEYFSELIRGIDQAARVHGLHLLVSSSHGDAAEAEAALRAMNSRVDGVLLMTPQAGAQALCEQLAPGLPAVLLNTPDGGAGLPRFAVANADGAAAMTLHLAEQGRQRIAFVRGPAGHHESDERLRGHLQALASLPGARQPLVFDGDFSEAAGQAVGQAIAALPAERRPDAVFAANDMMAAGCLLALAEAGIQVPAEVALAGFDDIPIARYLTPPLTTVHVPIAELGAAALEALVQRIEAAQADAADPSPASEAGRVLPVSLVVRRSSQAAPAAPVSRAGRVPPDTASPDRPPQRRGVDA